MVNITHITNLHDSTQLPIHENTDVEYKQLHLQDFITPLDRSSQEALELERLLLNSDVIFFEVHTLNSQQSKRLVNLRRIINFVFNKNISHYFIYSKAEENNISELVSCTEIKQLAPEATDEVIRKHITNPKVHVASTSQLKLTAVKQAFRNIGRPHIVRGYSSESGIPDQPIGFEQTHEGATNRLASLRSQVDISDAILISIENGLIQHSPRFSTDTGVVIASSKNQTYTATSTGLEIPEHILSEVLKPQGRELGTIAIEDYDTLDKDLYAGMTHYTLDRIDILTQAITMCIARIPGSSYSSSK